MEALPSQEEVTSDVAAAGLGRRARKKHQRKLDYERRRDFWMERYGSASALRSTFGSGPPWGDLSPQQTRALYHTLLPRSLLGLQQMGLMRPEELAPLAYEARIAAKEYARSRCVWRGRVITAVFDQYRSLKNRGRFLGVGSSSSMSWDEIWEKYEGQIVREECEEALLLDDDRSRKRTKLDEESLTTRIYARILEKSCATNKAFDSMYLKQGRGGDNNMESDLEAIASQLEEDVRSILLSPKDGDKAAKRAEKLQKEKGKEREKKAKELLKTKEKEKKRQRKAKKKQLEDKRKGEKRQRLRGKEVKNGEILSSSNAAIKEENSDANAEDVDAPAYSQRYEALRILAGTRLQFQKLFSK